MAEYAREVPLTFREYFPVPTEDNNWIRNPFKTKIDDVQGLTEGEEDQLLELSSCSVMTTTFDDSKSLLNFIIIARAD